MNQFKAIELIQTELKDLDVPKFSHAYKTTMQNAMEAAEIMSERELKKYIEEYLETLPLWSFQ